MTMRLGHYFSFIYLSPSPIYCTMDTLPSLLVTVLSWTYLLIPRRGQDALRTVRLSPLSITHPTLTPAVPLMRASVPADVHPLCPLYAHISSPLPYVSLHLLCTLPVRLLGALGLGCEFVHLAKCVKTWITTSFTLCQETQQSNGEELRIRRFEIFKRREKTTSWGGVRLRRIRTSRVSLPKSLY